LHKILNKLPVNENERNELEAAINTAAGKVVTKMIFGLRDALKEEEFLDCVEGLEKIYGE
ncbi:MAG: glutamyl-tRNA reductase, partial [Clostridia bacterium]|nr:glutamyl-tRNA reductase [Clostridia bacterium]